MTDTDRADEEPLIVAVDGPAGSGKSTVARAVAAKLGLSYLDTGAMYRSVAHAALIAGLDGEDPDAVAALAKAVRIEVGERVLVDGEDATQAIRSPEVTRAVTVAAANPTVRAEMVRRQRAWVRERGGGVVEGRDIGSVVFPQARLKVFLTATPAERERRRAAEAGEAVASDIARRDEADSTREHSPLTAAEDAITIDTTAREIDDVVDEILGLVAQRQLPGKGW
ncbi:MAG TPA: (d)CMP kinase [Acidimicrobiales bacterium]|nr:(d)CMP kinase [Acidimicrobiales bacterium]